MSPPTVHYEIVMIGSDAMIRGRALASVLGSIYRKIEASLNEGKCQDGSMQAEYDRLGGRGLLCKVIEPSSS